MEVDPQPALEAQRKAHPELGEQLDKLQKSYANKLYHQLTVTLLQYLTTGPFSTPAAASELLDLFEGFIKPLEGKLDGVKFVQILAIICKPQAPAKALELIAPFEGAAKKHRDTRFLWQALQAEFKVLSGDTDGAKDALDTLSKEIGDAYEVDAIIQSQLYKTSGILWKTLGRHQDYFKSSIKYLAFTPVLSIPAAERPKLAFEIGCAALIAQEEFEFGELLQQELLESLSGSEYAWIKDVLEAFGEGKFELFDSAMTKHRAKINATPELKAAEATVLRPKMCALALMELAFRKPNKQRRLGFGEIAEHCRIGPKEVEFLVMKAMCAKLIKGQIDEVQGIVLVNWVKPRILDKTHIDWMREQLDAWTTRTKKNHDDIEKNTPELLVS